MVSIYSHSHHISCAAADHTNLGEGRSIEAVLGGDLEADSAARGLGVPRGLGTSLNQRVDLVIVRGGEDAALVGGGDGGSPGRLGEADSGGEGGDAGLLDVVPSSSTGKETLVADNGIDVGGGALEQVGEGAEVEFGLLEVHVDLGARLLALRQEGEGTLELEALGDVVGGLDLGLERVQGVPRLCDGEAYGRGGRTDQQRCIAWGSQDRKADRISRLARPEDAQLELMLHGMFREHVGARSLEFGGDVAITIDLVVVLSLDLYKPRRKVSDWVALHFRTLHRNVFCCRLRARDMGPRFNRTVPEVFFSWLLLPVTLKATLLGVLLLTSMVPAETW